MLKSSSASISYLFAASPSPRRRGVSSVLAMMFMVIFSSLAAAMAVVAQSNLRSADSGLKLSRAMSAAETGLVFATRRLASESARFVITKGVIDSTFGDRLWMGTYTSSDGTVTILQPSGYNTGPGVIHAMRDAHNLDGHNITVTGAPSTAIIDTDQKRLRVPAAALSDAENSPYFILTYTYAVAGNTPYIRVASVGVDGDIRRTLTLDFKITKKIEFAILSPNRIMIGKNVLIEGPLGSRFGIVAGELNNGNGDPLVMRSDFFYLHADLDDKLSTLYAQILTYDVDGDNRLRPDHPQEVLGITGDLSDYDNDQYVDDFDLFLKHFDENEDRQLVYNAALAAAAGLGNLTVEYGDTEGDDNQLLRMLDEANADRDGDGEFGTALDRAFGWQDGVIDAKDQYAKVRGRLAFAVDRSSWDTAHGSSYQTIVKGSVRAAVDVPPIKFEVTPDEMREITTEMFTDTNAWFLNNATGDFAAQAGTPDPAQWEPVPYGAAEVSEEEFGTRGAYDYYNRPVYKNKTFTNVRIPKGTNALFEDCTFVGVTWVATNADCDHHDWNYVGAVKKVEASPGVFIYIERFPGLTANGFADTRPESNNLRFHNCTFLGSIAGDRPDEYTHWRNKIQMTGNTRFYIDPSDPDLAAQADAAQLTTHLNNLGETARAELEKSSVFMPGWSMDAGSFTNEAPKVKLKGTIIAGVFDIRGTADVFGTMLMTYRPVGGEGPLFYGGLADAFNTTIGYFHASDGDSEGGDPGDVDFDGFGEITLRYNPNAKLPDGIPWPITIQPDPQTYVE
jgi:hypothetical protein